jgi:hypothetical protein
VAAPLLRLLLASLLLAARPGPPLSKRRRVGPWRQHACSAQTACCCTGRSCGHRANACHTCSGAAERPT